MFESPFHSDQSSNGEAFSNHCDIWWHHTKNIRNSGVSWEITKTEAEKSGIAEKELLLLNLDVHE